MGWYVGGTVAQGTKFYDTSTPPVLVAATSVVATVTLPDGTSATPTVTNPSTGIYTFNYTAAQAGHHAVRWTGNVGGIPAKPYTDVFNVQEAAPALIISLDEARDYLNFDAAQTVNDEELRLFVEAVTKAIEKHVGPLTRRTVTTTINHYGPCVPLPFDPLSLTSAVLVRDGSTVNITNMVVENGVLRSKTYAPLPSEPWTLTCVVGRAVIPANIRIAAGQVTKDLWSSQRGAGGRRAGQGELTRLAFVMSYQALEGVEPDKQLGVA
jgi:hypothetical protein